MPINLLADEIARALSALQVATGNQTFTWNAQDIPCVPHMQEAHLMFGSGGFTPDYSLEMDVQHADMPSPGPQPPNLITFNQKKYRISKVVLNPDLSVRIYCNDPDRGAGIREREM